jgi:hypothetical protein
MPSLVAVGKAADLSDLSRRGLDHVDRTTLRREHVADALVELLIVAAAELTGRLLWWRSSARGRH